MSYYAMDHAGRMQNQIDACRERGRKWGKHTPEKLNEFQRRVVDILGIVGGGIYNAPIQYGSIDWDWGGGVSVLWRHDLATFDSSQLTVLVALAHIARIRVQIEPAMRYLRISFWQRTDEGRLYQRHPSIQDALASIESALPADHRIRYNVAFPAVATTPPADAPGGAK